MLTKILYLVCGFAAVTAARGQSLTWTQRQTGITPGHGLVAAAYGDGKFAVAAVAQDPTTLAYFSQVAFSSDAIAWNVVALPTAPTSYATDIVYGGGLWLVSLAHSVNFRIPRSDPNILTSPNGIDWTPVTAGSSGFGGSRYKVVHTFAGEKNLFVAAGLYGFAGAVVFSSDGATWSPATPAPNVNLTRLAAGNGVVVAGGGPFGGAGRLYSTSNGSIWTTHRLPGAGLGSGVLDLTFAGGEFLALVAADAGRRIYTSLDGTTWVAGPIITAPTGYAVGAAMAASTSLSSGKAVVLITSTRDSNDNWIPSVLVGRGALTTWTASPLGVSWPSGRILFARYINNFWLIGSSNTQLFTAPDTLTGSGTPIGGGIAFLSNLSVRALAGSGSETLIVGVTVGGGTFNTAKSVLIRGIGPTLTSFGVTGSLPDPTIAVLKGTTPLMTNDDWDPAGGIAATTAAVGAFPLPVGSRDSAIVGSGFVSGGYTVQLTGKAAATGNVLVELYDTASAASITATTARFINLSARAFGGTGSDTLILGFNVAGTGSRRLVIRAVGPALDAFGVTGTMPDPALELYSGTTKIGENDNWEDSTLGVQQAVGAFNLTSGSRDAVLVPTLNAGAYTAHVSGGTSGVVLVEVYEAP